MGMGVKLGKWGSLGVCAALSLSVANAGPKDPHRWLEKGKSKKTRKWVTERNAECEAKLEGDPRFEPLKNELRESLHANDGVGLGSFHGDYYYKLHRDADHLRGRWMRTPRELAFSDSPKWQTVLDLDELGRREGKSWVFAGALWFKPDYPRILIFLSDGGSDAQEVREFSLETKKFVKDGFNLPEGRHSISWFTEDSVLVGTDLGKGTLTKAGYPRQVRLWKRGKPLSKSKLLYQGKKSEMDVSGYRSGSDGLGIRRRVTFYEKDTYLRRKDGSLTRLPVPRSAQIGSYFNGHFLVTLKEDWKARGFWFKAGDIVRIPQDYFSSDPKLVFRPGENQSVEQVFTTEKRIYFVLLDHGKGRVISFKRIEGSDFKLSDPETVPFREQGLVKLSDFDWKAGVLIATYSDFVTPTTLYELKEAESGWETRLIRQAAPAFDASEIEVRQQEALSRDGSKVVYYVVCKKGLRLDGKNPTLLYGYGGFEVSQAPSYEAGLGKYWLEKGGVYVLASIRGGNELGPKWHQSALLENKQRSYDDFIAVAEDLIQQGVTTPNHLGIMGGSNGGLLVGAVMMQRPELFNAVVVQVPLLDMMRYHKLMVGASWMPEYGDPEDPWMAELLRQYAPYQNIRPTWKYPRVFFMTSSKDDRVDPGHARKMAEKMRSLGNEVIFYENPEGGHPAAADNEQRAHMLALEAVYLYQQLFGSLEQVK